jgi:phage FluMu protein gp41
MTMKFLDLLYGKFSDVSKSRDADGKVLVTRDGSVKVDRESLHSSDRFRRQIAALGKIDAKMKTRSA